MKISEFLAPFFPDEDEPLHLRFFKPRGALDTPDNRPAKLTTTRAAIAGDAATQAELRAFNRTRGAYFVVNAGGDTDEEITRFTAWFTESDTAPIAEQHAALDACTLRTSIRVETRKSVHAYWLVEGDCSAADWREIQARLIDYFAGDKAIKNPSRVMRLPGLDHVAADGSRVRVRCVEFTPDRRFTLAQIRAAFPPPEPDFAGAQPARQSVTAGQFATWDALRAELGRRITAHSSARRNSSGKWDCRALCHDGKGATGLFYDPATNQAHCNKKCEQATILRAFGLPDGPQGAIPQPEAWEPPQAFDEYELPDFPLEALPDWLRTFVEGLARETQTPVDLAALLALAALAGAVAGNVEIEARRGWCEPLNLFVVVALPPGNRKSAVFSSVVKPLESFEAGLIAEQRASVAKAESEHRTMAARLDHLEKSAARLEDQAERRLKQCEAAAAAEELARLGVPKLPRLLADDATPETLATLLHEQAGRLALFSPEGDTFDIMAGRYSSGTPNLGVYLKGHAGDDLRVDRRGRSEYVRRPALTVGLAVQPDVIRGLASKPLFKGRGLLGRFLYALPLSTLGSRKARGAPLEEEARAEYTRRVKAMAALSAGCDEEGDRVPRLLRLAADADDYLAAFQDEIEPHLAETGALGLLSDWAAKLAGAVLRLAGILHLAEHAGRFQNWPERVPDKALKQATEIGRYLIPHAQAAYAEMGADPEVEAAKYVLRWVLKWQESGSEEFRKQEAWQGVKGRFKKAADLDKALGVLCEHGFIRPVLSPEAEKRRGRRAGGAYEINPLAAPYNSYNSYNSPKNGNSRNCRNSRNKDGQPIFSQSSSPAPTAAEPDWLAELPLPESAPAELLAAEREEFDL